MDNYRNEGANIGKSVIVRGELSGSEDLFLDGTVEGSIDLQDHMLTVGSNGRVRANIRARQVIVLGRVEGNISGVERVELKKSAAVTGDIHTQRILIEDGAYFKGAIDIQKVEVKVAPVVTAPVAEAPAVVAPEVAPAAPAIGSAAVPAKPLA
jgi:cytoskeletal protein CcmA (bactofilin family)